MSRDNDLKDALASAIRIRDAAEASYEEYVRELDEAQKHLDATRAFAARQKMVGAGSRVEAAQQKVRLIEASLRAHNEAKSLAARHRYLG